MPKHLRLSILRIISYLLIFFFFHLKTKAQENSDTNQIAWSKDYKLKWNDFKGSPDINTSASASTGTLISYILIPISDSTCKAKIFSYFLKNSSWTFTKTNKLLLKHEQGHFDIAELFARTFRSKVEGKIFSFRTASLDVATYLVKILEEKDRYDELYDKETEHSINEERQSYWSKKILLEILSLDKYQD